MENELDILIQVHKANRMPNNLNAERPLRHIILKLSKVNNRERILKAARERG